jgi:CBS domain-containing protein
MRSAIARADHTVVHGAERALKARRPNHSANLPTAAHVMFRHPAVVDAHTSLFSAWGRLRGEHHQHLVVIDDDVRPIGILDERDIALEWPPNPLGAHHLPVHQLIRFRPAPRVHGSDDLAEVARTMLDHRTDAVTVVDDDGRLLGLVTVWQYLEFIAAWSMRNGLLRDESEPMPALAR